ncbi:MAG: SDR family NAD(P)-dependent oxidoreductase [Anaerolineales bacterium]|nr:MAG: SDR family NAD(P)-dependent oxidoreductase [Anaerolineales bacterium]
MGQILVTGAAGFIGSHVVKQLLAAGQRVVGLDNLNDAYDPRLKHWRLEQIEDHAGFTFKQVDITDEEALRAAWGQENFDGVINLAARAGVRQSVREPQIYFRANVRGLLNVLNLCRDKGVGKIVQASTSSLYGAHNPRPFTEDADISKPLSPYAASKGAAEMVCHSYHYLHGLEITILRYFTVYGPAGRPDMSIFRFIQWIAEEQPLQLYGDGKQERDFTFVEDIARGTLAALDCPGYEVINLGGDKPYPMLEMIATIEKLLGKRAKIDEGPEAPGDVRATWADISKANRLLGWKPETGFEEGLSATIDWYKQERAWASKIDTSV